MLISKTVCHQGLVRDLNEDSCMSNSDESVWLVADGVGGNVGGECASQLAVQTVDRKLRQGLSFRESIEEANQAILSVVSQQAELQGMATTLIGVKFDGYHFNLAWVGDSRAYLISPGNGIKRLSADHNVAYELFEQGEISETEMFTHQGQHELTQALGQMSLLEIPELSGELNKHCYLLLCTDGLSGVLTESDIFKTISLSDSLDKISDSLLKQVLKAGAPDNITFTLIKHQSDESGEGREQIGVAVNNRSKFKNKASITWFVLLIVITTLLLTLYLD